MDHPVWTVNYSPLQILTPVSCILPPAFCLLPQKSVNSSSMETVAQIPKYNLNEEQEKKLILREYRSLLRSLKSRIKPGDRKLIRHAFEMAAEAHKTMAYQFAV